jgi:hypothetical protein
MIRLGMLHPPNRAAILKIDKMADVLSVTSFATPYKVEEVMIRIDGVEIIREGLVRDEPGVQAVEDEPLHICQRQDDVPPGELCDVLRPLSALSLLYRHLEKAVERYS